MQITNSKIFWPLCGIALLVVIFFSFSLETNRPRSVALISALGTQQQTFQMQKHFFTAYIIGQYALSYTLASVSTFNSFLAGLGRNRVYVACCFFPNRQYKPVRQTLDSRSAYHSDSKSPTSFTNFKNGQVKKMYFFMLQVVVSIIYIF